MALLTLISLASEIASNEKAVENISKFANKSATFLKNLMRDEDDLPEISAEDIALVFDYNENLFCLLGLLIQEENKINNKRVLIIEEIIEEVCFGETGNLQEPVLISFDSSKQGLLEMISRLLKTPISMKKVTRFATKYSLEYEFFDYFCRVAFNSSEKLSEYDIELLDSISESFEINRFDKKEIEKKYKS